MVRWENIKVALGGGRAVRDLIIVEGLVTQQVEPPERNVARLEHATRSPLPPFSGTWFHRREKVRYWSVRFFFISS